MTFSELAAAAVQTLRQAGIDDDTARRDAVLLARHLAGWDAGRWLIESRSATVPPELSTAFAQRLARRARREPLAYIVGEREFYGRAFSVAPGVLIPRPETELIVDAVLELARSRVAPRVLDVGTGSGCLAITIALALREAVLTATDSSATALDIARANAMTYGVESRIDWRAGDLLAESLGPFDIILSNPPYVPDRDRSSLEPEVVQYEPSSALFGGDDGLDVIRRLVPAAAKALSPDGWLVFEIGHGQASAVEQIVNQTSGLCFVRFVSDLQSVPRVAVSTPRIHKRGEL
jgi:release factor glutamine methyltransferase